MKLTLFLFFLGITQMVASEAYSQTTKMTLQLSDATVKEVLNRIEENSEFFFLYNSKLVDVDRKVDVDVKDQKIDEILNSLFQETDVVFTVVDRQIVLTNKADQAGFMQQPQRSISGKVTDQAGGSIPGASVVVKGTTTGVTTDNGGNYSLILPEEAQSLVFSFVGMKTQEVVIGNKAYVNITLLEEAVGLEEVVAVGYGTQKRTSLTASIATLPVKNMTNLATGNLTNAMAGRIAGVLVAQSSGEVGGDAGEIHIRGIGTTGGNGPLLIVDGVPRGFDRLDPNTIKTFTVLKDAAAVAPYGLAGANGVILVTTKRGETGAPTLSYNGYIGWQNPTKLPDLVNSYQYATMRNIADKAAGNPIAFTDADIAGYKKTVDGAPDADRDKYPNTDALAALINRDVPITSHTVQMTGGKENIKYFMALGYIGQQGLFGKEYDKRYNMVANIDSKVGNYTLVALSLSGYNDVRHRPQLGGLDPFATAQAYLPIYNVNFSNGMLANSLGKVLRPGIELGDRMDDNTSIRTQLSVQQDLPFIKGLNIKGVVSYDPTHSFTKNWSEPTPTYYNINTSVTPYTYNPVTNTGKPGLGENYSKGSSISFQGYINYHNTFGQHDITGLLVMDARKTRNDNFGASRSNYDLAIDELSLGSPLQTNWGTSGGSSQTRQVGYVYRLSYAFQNKYLFETTGRYDGSYVFGTGNRFGFFPAFSAGWRVSEESFIKDNYPWITNLKLRGSYGESGNLVGPDQWSSSLAINSNVYVINGLALQGATERTEPNPFITWEKAKKANIGLETTLWNGLLGFELDYFYEKRDNMLVSPSSVVPQEYGIGIAQVNAGKMDNKGIDLTISSYHEFSNGIRLDLTGTFTYANNKLIEIYENQTTLNNPVRSRTGRSLGTNFGLQALGLFQVEDDKNGDGKITATDGFPTQFGTIAPGDIRYQDTNLDGKVDASDEVAIGNPVFPKIQFGLSPRISYKGFDLAFFLQGATKTSNRLQNELVWPFNVGANASVVSMDYWTPENPNAEFPRLYGQGGNTNNQQVSSFWLRDLTYLRLKSLEVGYTLPPKVLKTIKVQAVRFYASATNLFTLDHIHGLMDPEMTNSGNNIRGWYYPYMKTATIGINVTF